MKRSFSIGIKCIFLVILLPLISYAQLLEVKTLAEEGLYNSQSIWADFNKNDSLEVLVIGTNSSDEASAFVIRNIWRTNPLYQNVNIKPLTDGTITVSDINNDAFPDVLISGKDTEGNATTLLYYNRSAFEFELANFSFPGLHNGNNLIVDFNNDGYKDLFVNGYDQQGNSKVGIFKNIANQFSEIDTDIIGLGEGAAFVLDYNKDGLSDLVLTGIDETGKKRSILYKNEGNFTFSIEQEFEGLSSGSGAVGDFDQNGFTDILLSGIADGDVRTTSLYFNRSGRFELSNLELEGMSMGQVFIADMNHDGMADIVHSGLDAADQYKAKIYYGSSEAIVFEEEVTSLLEQNISIGDANRDGNLDLFQVGITEDGAFRMNYFHNLTAEPNLGPSPASNPVVLPLRGKAIFFWEPASDDISPSSSLTYDIFVTKEGDGIKKIPDASLASGYRRTVDYGSQQQDTTWFMNGLKEGIYDWGILSQDNAFRGDNAGGICEGGSFRMCFEITSLDTTICEKGPVSFNSDNGPVHIYSVNKGYLGIHNEIDYDVVKSDTLYFVSTDPMVCTSSFEIAINLMPDEDKLDLGEDLLVCKGEEVALALPEGYQAIKWSLNGEDIGSDPGFNASITQSSEILVEASNSNGCVFKDTIHVNIRPDLQIHTSEDATIQFGESIAIFASGGETYRWMPESSLSDPAISNPTASPESTTTYTVTSKDEFGCEAVDSVKITVETNLFVPNLFSPNGDGNNEVFKIYGGSFNDLVFQVFDRSGSLVYEGKNNEPFASGWDGNKNGKPQPAGAYIWRLKGKNDDGSWITYEGKSSGTVNLVR